MDPCLTPHRRRTLAQSCHRLPCLRRVRAVGPKLFLHTERNVSWIFALLLVGYGLLRAVLWIRGQVMFRLAGDRVVQRAQPRPTPEHLSSGLASVFEATDELRLRLVEDVRTISILQIVDPDVPLGHVRDARFRAAVLDAWMRLRRWRAATQRHDESAIELSWLHDDVIEAGRRLDAAAETIRPIWWQAVRARPLDPFEMEDVLKLRNTLEYMVTELERVQDRMSELEAHPYRGSALAPHAPVELSG